MSDDKPNRFRIPKPGIILAVGLVLVLIAIVLAVWLPYQREVAIVREIEQIGGMVGTYPRGPEWLPEWALDEWMTCFDGIYTVGLSNTSISDPALRRIGKLMNLRILDLAAAKVSRDGWRHLQGFTKLEWLMLHETEFGDESLRYLRGLRYLRRLALDGTQVSDDGLNYLNSLSNLRQLSLQDTQVTEAGVRSLKQKLPHCEIVR